MGRRLTTINASDIKKAKENLKAISPIGLTGILLKAIVFASQHDIKKVCEEMYLSRDTLHRWMRSYKEYGRRDYEIIKPSLGQN